MMVTVGVHAGILCMAHRIPQLKRSTRTGVSAPPPKETEWFPMSFFLYVVIPFT